LDATNSFDPDLGDEIQFVWKQIAGPNVKIMPNPFEGKVSFEGKEGEYTFELTVADDYGSKATITKTVIIIAEPNQPPVIEMNVRQGSELK
jgi:PKD repeat protein